MDNPGKKWISQEKSSIDIIRIKETKLSVLFDNNPEIFDILKVHNFEDPDEIPKPKYLMSPVNIIVLDDLMATGAFTNKKLSSLTNNLIKKSS